MIIIKTSKFYKTFSQFSYNSIVNLVSLDNLVAESNFKSLKFEFVYQNQFENLEELKRKLGGHIWWYNNKRLHSSLGYKTPIEYKMIHS